MRIVCCTDLSPEALAAARLTHALAHGFEEEEDSVDVKFLHVLKPEWYRLDRGRTSPIDDPDNVERIEEEVRKWFRPELGTGDYEIVLREGKPASEIAEYAAETEADYLVTGQSGSGFFARMQLGSTAHKLAQNPPCELFLAHRSFKAFQAPRRVVVGVDFEDVSARALREAALLAQSVDAELDVVHIFDEPRPMGYPGGLLGHPVTTDDIDVVQTQLRADLRAFLGQHDDVLRDLTVHTHVRVGSPTRRIIEHARARNADVLCMGTVSHGALQTTVLGSVAGGVVRHMPCTILLTPPA